jgi:AraC family transcriptional regulator
MLLLRTMPNVADTPENAAFRRWFYSKWGKENCIVTGRVHHAEYPRYRQRLSIKAAWGGAERYHIDGRTVAVDDDTYLVINDSREYSSVLSNLEPMQSFAIFFRPGLAEETLGSMLTDADRLLQRGTEADCRPVEFAELLRPHDGIVTPILKYIAQQVDAGLDDELWYEEQLSFLLERMLRAHRTLVESTRNIRAARVATRCEMFKRISRSTDYIHTHYARALTADELAAAAHLSKFHFIRLFRAVHGVTPYAYLQRKRAMVAKRLLETIDFGHEEIALRAGFDHRCTMFRQLVRWMGISGRGVRQARTCGVTR